ncbi:MAG: hypothetical protein GF315_02735, partial [candidate division Zixibacteria bacterium]|nr:hypothetical protein [candidate division Zixibacteria bacterium]
MRKLVLTSLVTVLFASTALAGSITPNSAGVTSGIPYESSGNDILQAGCCIDVVGPDDSWTFATSDVEVGPYVVYDNYECPDLMNFGHVQWWGLDLQWNNGWYECTEDPMDFEIIFYDDNGNYPGNIVCGPYNVTADVNHTAIWYAGVYELVEYNADLSPACTYTANGWVSIQGTSAYGDSCVFLWGNSFGGDMLGYQDQGGTLVPLDYDLSKCFTEGGEPPCCDVDMTPDDDPVIVPPGGSFGFTGYIGNPTADPIVTDVWGGVIYMGNFYQQFAFNNIPLNPGQFLSAHTSQHVPGFAPQGTYIYRAYCGDRPSVKCDSAEFPFTVTGARVSDNSEWFIEGEFFGINSNYATLSFTPDKAPYSGPINKPDQGVILQGGDTVNDATPIGAVPYSNTGTTSGYTNDYDEVCPFTGSTSPDVVYSFVPSTSAIYE